MATKKDIKETAGMRKKPVERSNSVVDFDHVGSDAGDTRLDKLQQAMEQRRKSRQQEDTAEDKPALPPPVSLGPTGAIVDALLNTAPEHMLELTDFNRNQVVLIPQVVVTDDMWDFIEQVLSYRVDKDAFFRTTKRKYPEVPNLSRRYVYVLAQTSRSRDGKLKKALEDMALAELETKSMDEGAGLGGHDFED